MRDRWGYRFLIAGHYMKMDAFESSLKGRKSFILANKLNLVLDLAILRTYYV